MKTKLLPYAALALFVAEMLLCLVSWIVSVLLPESGVRSAFSGEGLRWLMGHYAEFLASPFLAWLLLLSMAYGTCRGSGIGRLLVPGRAIRYRERIAVVTALCTAVVYLGVVALLSLIPHAMLLSATGRLFPSPFASALVPLACFGTILVSVVYGVVSGALVSVSGVYRSLVLGISKASGLFLFYLLLIQLYYTLCFAFLQNTNYWVLWM